MSQFLYILHISTYRYTSVTITIDINRWWQFGAPYKARPFFRCMINYTLHFEQDRIHNWWHSQYTDSQQVLFYHRYYACWRCYPPVQPNTLHFEHFWNWYAAENPAIIYTRYTQQALEDLNNARTVTETWDAVYLIVFSIRYSTEPKPYTELRQDIYNAFILTEGFWKDPFEELY